MKSCIFIDTANFKHSIQDLFAKDSVFDANHFLPKTAKWSEFFSLLLSKTRKDTSLIRTYFFYPAEYKFYPNENDIKSISEFWDKFKKSSKDSDMINEVKQNLPQGGFSDNDFNKQELSNFKTKYEEVKRNLERKQKRFVDDKRARESICSKYEQIEFSKFGVSRFDLINNEFKTEKGVDVNLAVDMIRLSSIFDICILVSGDQDFIPAIQYLKDNGKLVYVVAFVKKNGRKVAGVSPKIIEVCDGLINISYQEAKQNLYP